MSDNGRSESVALKASEVIAKLQELIQRNGDLPVYLDDMEYWHRPVTYTGYWLDDDDEPGRFVVEYNEDEQRHSPA